MWKLSGEYKCCKPLLFGLLEVSACYFIFVHFHFLTMYISLIRFFLCCFHWLNFAVSWDTVTDWVAIFVGGTLCRQAGKFVKELGQIMGVQVLIEAPMNSSSPYFSSSWRRDPNFKVRKPLPFATCWSGHVFIWVIVSCDESYAGA